MNEPLDPITRRILVIDDNPTIHEDFRKILCAGPDATPGLAEVEDALFGTTPAPAGARRFKSTRLTRSQEGLAMIQRALEEKRPYPMAFVDVRMPPGWDGIETISHIWKEYPDLQVVVCISSHE